MNSRTHGFFQLWNQPLIKKIDQHGILYLPPDEQNWLLPWNRTFIFSWGDLNREYPTVYHGAHLFLFGEGKMHFPCLILLLVNFTTWPGGLHLCRSNFLKKKLVRVAFSQKWTFQGNETRLRVFSSLFVCLYIRLSIYLSVSLSMRKLPRSPIWEHWAFVGGIDSLNYVLGRLATKGMRDERWHVVEKTSWVAFQEGEFANFPNIRQKEEWKEANRRWGENRTEWI